MDTTKDGTSFITESIVKEELIMEDDLITSEAEEDLPQERPQSKNSTRTTAYFCEICNKSFSAQKKLRSHIRIHKPSTLPCSICKKTFKENYLLERHMRAHERYDKPKEYRCEHCDKVFEMITIYKIHLKTHRSHPYKCSVCSKSFPERYFLRNHEKLSHGISPPPPDDSPETNPDRPNYCKECDKTLKTRKIFVNHMRRHKYVKEGVFRCIPCDKSFADNYSLILHENRVHNKSKAVPQELVELHCEICNEVFCSQKPYSDLQRHQRKVHKVMHGIISGTVKRGTEEIVRQADRQIAIKEEPTEDETSESIEQNDEYNPESIVKEELIIEDNEETPTLHCDVCGKSFSNARQYYLHQRRHRESVFLCSICQKSFKEKSELERHVRIHRVLSNKAVETEYHCSKCDKTFSMETLFKCHMRRHGEPIYKCSVCPRAFPIKSDLSKHEKNFHQIVPTGVAEGEKELDSIDAADSKLYCEECDKYFKQRKTYLTHVRRHKRIQEGVFRCEACQKTFCNKFTLLVHQNGIQHKNNVKDPAKCDVCQMVLSSKRKLAKHKKEIHSAPPEFDSDIQQGNAANMQQVKIKMEPDEFSQPST